MTQEITTLDLGGVNCYLLNTADGFILVDTGGGTMFGADPESIRLKLDAELECAGCKPGNLKLVILTHGDGDHSGNAAYIREKFKTKIAMHRADAEKVENPGCRQIHALD